MALTIPTCHSLRCCSYFLWEEATMLLQYTYTYHAVIILHLKLSWERGLKSLLLHQIRYFGNALSNRKASRPIGLVYLYLMYIVLNTECKIAAVVLKISNTIIQFQLTGQICLFCFCQAFFLMSFSYLVCSRWALFISR